MSDLTYDDYKRRLSIQEVLIDAGYTLNRRDGLRYPAYVRIGSDGRRIRGDKFIVTANGLCCFHPPEQKNYNVISFIKEHPTLFSEYTHGMSKDRLVNVVCQRLLNEPIEIRASKVMNPKRQTKPFDINDYDCQSFNYDDWETQKRFYPYFKNREITLDTQKAFCGHFLLTTKHREDSLSFTNLSFPLSSPLCPGQEPIGLEERSRPNAEGKTAYKGLAAGSDATDGLWIARLEGHRSDMGFHKPLGASKDIYWFESAYDALAYYQIMKKENPIAYHDLGNSVYVSTAGNPSQTQIRGMLEQTKDANHHLCFDRDDAGQTFAKTFKQIHQEVGLSEEKVAIEYPKNGYKDWNDQVMNRTMDGLSSKDNQENERPHFRR